ncbi:MAG: hypothetical protein A2Y93_06635 [Chloroflexi bacterium RBG_13_68_17]|nr:MAG: hypothetical protein A2Y93_06635 [Chloroflexi bacterium RBG_13_68_17]
MKVLFLAAEAAPLVKIGGLADVAGELPRALRARGLDVRLVLPWHASLSTQGLSPRRAVEVVVPSRGGAYTAQVHTAELAGMPVWLISGEPIGSSASVYSDPPRDSFKYAFFCLAALRAAESLGEIPDLVHGNDWHSAAAVLAVARARASHGPWHATATLLTIHNLPYMGVGGGEALEAFGLAASADERLPDWARLVPLAQALAEADWLTTVSPTYAREIQTAEHGAGLEGVLSARAGRLTGILNGLDLERWDPARDKALYQRFRPDELPRRRRNKAGLLTDLGLDARGEIPLLAMVTRLDHQKGVDLALDALQSLPDPDWQFVLLGKGDSSLEERALTFASGHAETARSILRYDDRLARCLYGGADALLVPSRYEPCGLVQMVAMHYGCLPIARATGGLRDTVCEPAGADGGTGFLFEEPSPEDLRRAVERARTAYREPERWRALQENAMAQDLSWDRSAELYLQVYEKAVGVARGAA